MIVLRRARARPRSPRRASPKMLPPARSIPANPSAAERELPPTRCSMGAKIRCRAACRKLRSSRGRLRVPARRPRGAPYSVSPTTGCPMAEKCARIWCVRPVCSAASTKRATVQARDHAPVGPGVAALGGTRRHARAAARIAGNGQSDRAGIARHFSVHEREVYFSDVSRAELFGEIFVRLVIPRDDHRAGRFAIQAMHDARPQRAARSGKISQAVQERVHQRPRRVARAGMDHHPGGLVHDYEIVVDV